MAAISGDETPEGVLVISAWSPQAREHVRFRARVSMVTTLDGTERRTVEAADPDQVVALVAAWLSDLGRDVAVRDDQVADGDDGGLSAD